MMNDGHNDNEQYNDTHIIVLKLDFCRSTPAIVD